MDSSTQNENDNLKFAIDEIETVLKKYDLCGFFTLANQHNGIQHFSFQNYCGMEWQTAENGRMIGTKINLKMKQHNIVETFEIIRNCYVISDYFASVLFNQAEHMQQINDDLISAFNLDRNELIQNEKIDKMH